MLADRRRDVRSFCQQHSCYHHGPSSSTFLHNIDFHISGALPAFSATLYIPTTLFCSMCLLRINMTHTHPTHRNFLHWDTGHLGQLGRDIGKLGHGTWDHWDIDTFIYLPPSPPSMHTTRTLPHYPILHSSSFFLCMHAFLPFMWAGTDME